MNPSPEEGEGAVEIAKWCGAQPELKTQPPLNRCCLEPGHDGPHRFWVQERSEGAGYDDYGIRTYDPNGKAVQFLEVKGRFSDEEVAAIVQYLEMAMKAEQSGGHLRQQ